MKRGERVAVTKAMLADADCDVMSHVEANVVRTLRRRSGEEGWAFNEEDLQWSDWEQSDKVPTLMVITGWVES